MSVFDAKNPYHRHLIPVNIKTGVLIKNVLWIDLEKHLIEIMISHSLFFDKEKFEGCLLSQFTKYKRIEHRLKIGEPITLTIRCENVRVITKDDDPYDFIQCPNYMDFRFFKEKVIPAMKVARGLGKAVSIETFNKYIEYPKLNFKWEKGY